MPLGLSSRVLAKLVNSQSNLQKLKQIIIIGTSIMKAYNRQEGPDQDVFKVSPQPDCTLERQLSIFLEHLH